MPDPDVACLQGDWNWVNEAKQGAKQPKWGYISSSVGDELTLKLSRSKSAASMLGLESGNSSVLVGLGVLKSYKDMGAAAVSCSQGCACTPQLFEMQHKQEVSSAWSGPPTCPLHALQVSLDLQHKQNLRVSHPRAMLAEHVIIVPRSL